MSVLKNSNGKLILTGGKPIDIDTPFGSWEPIANSVDVDGSPFNNGLGYLDGYRINSSGAVVEASTCFVTGFIPIPSNYNVITAHINMSLPKRYVAYLVRYDENKTQIGSLYGGSGEWLSLSKNNIGSFAYLRISFFKQAPSESPLDCGATVKITTS